MSQSKSMSISVSQSTKVAAQKKTAEKSQCPKCLVLFPKAKASSHIASCKSQLGQASKKSKFTNYSPIREADEDGRYQHEESKDSSTGQKRRPANSDDSETEQS